jgi:hypothetical protein
VPDRFQLRQVDWLGKVMVETGFVRADLVLHPPLPVSATSTTPVL